MKGLTVGRISSGLRWIICFLLLIALTAGWAVAESGMLPEDPYAGKEPTCTESGYRVREEQGIIRMEEIPPEGHRFSDWLPDAENREKTRVCQVCGYEERVRISSIPEDSIARLDMTGSLEGIGKKDRAALRVSFTDGTQSFQCWGLLTLQGHSTFGLPKKNYTIRFYDDAEGNQKHRVIFRNWNREHKFILKANYTDVSQCRNLVSAGIWADMAGCRERIPERLADLPTHGAVDGFPISVYLNGEFFGLYTLNLHKDDDLYKMKKGKQEALLICNAQTTDESLFRAPAAFLPDFSSDWEIEYCGTEDETWVRERFNGLIAFVRESSDSEFREQLGEWLDTDAAIDYLLYLYALGLRNGGAKDLVMLWYGGPWIPSAYDLEEAFGLDADTGNLLPAEDFLPIWTEGQWNSGTGSLLWDRLLNLFAEPLLARYWELRKGPLSEETMTSRIHAFVSGIPESFYDYDVLLYPGRKGDAVQAEQQMTEYIHERLLILDGIFGGGSEE